MNYSPYGVEEKEEKIETNINIVNSQEETTNNADIYTELMKLEDLRQKNVLTEEEFQIQKKRLLANH